MSHLPLPVREKQLPTPPRCPGFHIEGLCQALFRRGSCRSLFHERQGAGVAGLQKAAAPLLVFSPCTEVLRSRKKREGLRNRGGDGGTCKTQRLLLTSAGLLTLFCWLLVTSPHKHFKIYPSGSIGSELCGRSYLQECSVQYIF